MYTSLELVGAMVKISALKPVPKLPEIVPLVRNLTILLVLDPL
jgi:hypothetical protein